jgi:hypothetical protein
MIPVLTLSGPTKAKPCSQILDKRVYQGVTGMWKMNNSTFLDMDFFVVSPWPKYTKEKTVFVNAHLQLYYDTGDGEAGYRVEFDLESMVGEKQDPTSSYSYAVRMYTAKGFSIRYYLTGIDKCSGTYFVPNSKLGSFPGTDLELL